MHWPKQNSKCSRLVRDAGADGAGYAELAGAMLHEPIQPQQLTGMPCVLAAVASLAWQLPAYGRVEL